MPEPQEVPAECLRAAVLLARARNGEDTVLEAEFAARLDVAGRPEEVARGAAMLLGALGQALLEREAVGSDVDGIDMVAAGLRRLRSADTVRPEALPLVAGLLTAALVTRIDIVDWFDQIGPRPSYLAPTVEVLAAVIALVDAAYARPGFGGELVTSLLR